MLGNCSLAEKISAGEVMQGFRSGADRQQTTLLPECLADLGPKSQIPFAAFDVFVDALELRRPRVRLVVDPAATWPAGDHP